MVTFINDILVAIDTKKGHDKLVEEVLKRLEENDLFVKLEKCKQKVKEVEFLGVVISPREVEIQKEKVEGVLNWLAPRNIKKVQKFLGLANYYRRFIKKLYQDSSTATYAGQEGAEIKMGKGTEGGI